MSAICLGFNVLDDFSDIWVIWISESVDSEEFVKQRVAYYNTYINAL